MEGISRGIMFSSLFILVIKFAETLCFGFEIVQLIYFTNFDGLNKNKWVQMRPIS